MDTYVARTPERYTAVRLSVDERDDEVIKRIFDGCEYIAGYENKDGNKHYHIMVVGSLNDAVKKRKSRFAMSKSGATTWTKPNWGTWNHGVMYTIKDGEWWASSDAWRSYAQTLPAYEAPVRDDDAPVNPQDRKHNDWPLSERNVRRLYNKYKHNVPPRADGVYDFFDVLQWILRNTNWNLNRHFQPTPILVRQCETGDKGDQSIIDRLRGQCRWLPY